MKRIPELDGLRGFAIITVLLYHLSLHLEPTGPSFLHLKTIANALTYPISNLGWAGVDLFFVLSGFLITWILLAAKESPHYFRSFYTRRVLRIFPIYYLSLLVLVIVLPGFYPSMTMASVYREQVYYWLYLQNWLETFRVYTGFRSEYLGHTWSLAVEEQFYLVWPLIVFVLKPRQLAATAVLIVVGSLLLRCAVNLFVNDNFAAYSLVHFNFFTRFDAPAIGSLIAYAERYKGPQLAALGTGLRLNLVFVFLLALLASIVAFAPADPQITNVLFRTIGYTVVIAIFALLVIKAIVEPSTSILRRALRNPELVYCGVISYGLYIYHWPIFYFWSKFGPHQGCF